MSELLIIIYFIVATLVGIWAVGVQHAFEIKHFSRLNNTPDYFTFFTAYLFILPSIMVTMFLYGGYGWVWPKKGVTYQ
jgi:amino acid transporter